MSGRLADTEARIATVHQLSMVISAMRGIAAARTAEANKHLHEVRAYEATIAEAISRVLKNGVQAPDVSVDKNETARHFIVGLCAEQGFAGSFSDRILDRVDAVERQQASDDIELMLVGDRGLLVAAERELQPVWSTGMISSVQQATLLTNRVMDALYERIDGQAHVRVSLVHASPNGSSPPDIVVRRLFPFDFSRFPPARGGQTPSFNLPPTTLLESLVGEYVFAEICEAVVLSFAAENQARMHAMISAQDNVSDTLANLTATSRRLRQDEITEEISELSASYLRESQAMAD